MSGFDHVWVALSSVTSASWGCHWKELTLLSHSCVVKVWSCCQRSRPAQWYETTFGLCVCLLLIGGVLWIRHIKWSPMCAQLVQSLCLNWFDDSGVWSPEIPQLVSYMGWLILKQSRFCHHCYVVNGIWGLIILITVQFCSPQPWPV